MTYFNQSLLKIRDTANKENQHGFYVDGLPTNKTIEEKQKKLKSVVPDCSYFDFSDTGTKW